MGERIISLRNALRIMANGRRCSVVFCTYSDVKKTGGERRRYDNAILLNEEQFLKKESRKIRKTINKPTEVKTKRDPNHDFNCTINIQLPNGDIKKMSKRLMEGFNGKTVTL